MSTEVYKDDHGYLEMQMCVEARTNNQGVNIECSSKQGVALSIDQTEDLIMQLYDIVKQAKKAGQ